MDIFWKYEKAKNNQQPTYTGMLRNSSLANASNLDIDTL